MSNQNVEVVTSVADRAKVGVALAAVVAGLVGFYALSAAPMIARVGAVIAGLAVGACIAWTALASAAPPVMRQRSAGASGPVPDAA